MLGERFDKGVLDRLRDWPRRSKEESIGRLTEISLYQKLNRSVQLLANISRFLFAAGI
ncbi:hypothetical protein S7335_2047 [Synechococcus sp. PCC 7335]|nr:hypothetical protein S7335_2047 [Synechococcus sp. PCC 7335]